MHSPSFQIDVQVQPRLVSPVYPLDLSDKYLKPEIEEFYHLYQKRKKMKPIELFKKQNSAKIAVALMNE